MAHWKVLDPAHIERGNTSWKGPAGFAAVALAGLSLLALARLVPAPLLLPTLSIVLLTMSGGCALLAWRLNGRRRPDRIDLWDIAGACAFVGCAAAMLSQPEHVLGVLP
jgi:hypothetical protein